MKKYTGPRPNILALPGTFRTAAVEGSRNGLYGCVWEEPGEDNIRWERRRKKND